MKSSFKSGLIGCILGFLLALLIGIGYFMFRPGGEIIEDPNPVPPEKKPIVKTDDPKPMQEIKKDPVPVSAVDRVVSRALKAEFGMVGKGEDAKWGVSKVANFKYTVIVDANSEIQDKEVLPGGEIKVTEIRTFNKVQDSIVVSDVDIKLALDTLPIKVFSQAIDTAVTAWASFTGDVTTPAVVSGVKDYVEEKLRSVDGTGVRALLGTMGLKPNSQTEAMINQIAGAKLLKALGGIREISGKSYQIVYYQEASGKPMLVRIKYSNGEEVTDEEEQMVLKRVNSFIDYNTVPNKECKPGDSWTVYAKDMQEVFDPFVDGIYSGSLKATRMSNDGNGDWTIQMSPGVIDVINDDGNTTGHMKLQKGVAHVNPKLVSINDLFVEGKASLQKLSKHHWLFTARISGECDFQGRAVTVPVPEE